MTNNNILYAYYTHYTGNEPKRTRWRQWFTIMWCLHPETHSWKVEDFLSKYETRYQKLNGREMAKIIRTLWGSHNFIEFSKQRENFLDRQGDEFRQIYS